MTDILELHHVKCGHHQYYLIASKYVLHRYYPNFLKYFHRQLNLAIVLLMQVSEMKRKYEILKFIVIIWVGGGGIRRHRIFLGGSLLEALKTVKKLFRGMIFSEIPLNVLNTVFIFFLR